MLLFFTKRFIEKEVLQIDFALRVMNTLWTIKIYFRCRFIIIVYHVYVVVLNVLFRQCISCTVSPHK